MQEFVFLNVVGAGDCRDSCQGGDTIYIPVS